MCGITGFLTPAGFASGDAQAVTEAMAMRLVHRGPDDAGVWLDGEAGIALGHRRLSIVDLSDAGQQPMVSASGRYVMSFNGEIYNHRNIRQEIDRLISAPAWNGHSDTETILAAVDLWGIESALRQSVGMFAIALWDREERTLILARDRMGEKPLYYGWHGNSLLFASELKSMRIHPAFQSDISPDAITAYLRDGYIASPRSIYQNTYKLLPGTFLKLRASGLSGHLPKPIAYWSLNEVARDGLANPIVCNDDEAIGALENCIGNAIKLQRVADVPLGAFLSGGIDSSTVVALMQAQSCQPVRSFTIGFHELDYNEATYAKSVAQCLGTEHTELFVTPQEAMDIIPQLPEIYDEPFGDSSAIPTILVSRLARAHVTASLSGDGGDELFGGYSRYQQMIDIWSRIDTIPGQVRRIIAPGLRLLLSRNSQKQRRLVSFMESRNINACYNAYLAQRTEPETLVQGAAALPNTAVGPESPIPQDKCLETMMYVDSLRYLPDDILAKVDRAAMHVSLEARVPLLDHRVVELAWRLPTQARIRHGEGKWVLKQILRKYLPDNLIDRPKMGFGVPVGRWLKGPLRDWAEGLLEESNLRQQGLLNAQLVRGEWSKHLRDRLGSGDRVWQLLAFQAWLSSLESA